jgi:hypothetical protein
MHEAQMAVTGFTKALELLKAIRELTKNRELNDQIIPLQSIILDLQTQHSELIDTKRKIEQKLIEYENWNKEKANYERKRIHDIWVYVPKPDSDLPQENYWVCENCMDNKRLKSVFQLTERAHTADVYKCQNCPTVEIRIPINNPNLGFQPIPWRDPNYD